MLGLFVLCQLPLAAQQDEANQEQPVTANNDNDPVLLIGISIKDIIARFGPPDAVYPIRGAAEWQDDVVFEYKSADFYLFKDHVWQIGLKQANGIRLGDAKMAISLVHGNVIEDKGTYITAPVLNRAWPIQYRYNVDAKGKISAIFLYRVDF